MINIEGLVNHLEKNYRERLKLLATIEEIRQHHLVKDNAEFYLDKNGELKARIIEENDISYAERLQIQGRIAKIHPLLDNYNQTYKRLRKIITELPPEKALYILKECAKESIKLYDEINDVLVKDMKQCKALPEDFEGKVDISTLKNLSRNFTYVDVTNISK